MASNKLLEQLLSKLSGYHATLVKHVWPPSDAVPTNELRPDIDETMVWIKVKTSTRAFGKWIDGLEMLALLASVDWGVWIQQLKTIWPAWTGDVHYERPPRVGIEVRALLRGRSEPVFAWLGMSSPSHSQSIELSEARELVRRIIATQDEVLTHMPVRLHCYAYEKLDASLFHVMQLVLTQKHFDDVGDAYKASVSIVSRGRSFHGLLIRSIVLPYQRPQGPLLTKASLECLRVIAGAGVAISCAGIVHSSVRDDRLQLMHLLWELLAVGETDADVCSRYLQHIGVKLAYSMAMSTAVLSAICASGSLRAITVNEGRVGNSTATKNRPGAWKWIPYALFSGSSARRCSIQRVTLNVGWLTDTDVQQIREVVAAADPVSVLVGRPSSAAMGSVSASRFYLSDPTTTKKKKTQKKDSEDATSVKSANVLHELPVLKRSKVWTTVLLPGWGEAWVHRDDVIATTRGDSGPFGIHEIAQVTLTCADEGTRDAVMDLLRLIGPGIRKLTIQATSATYARPEGFVVDGWVHTILDACPHLENLEMKDVGREVWRFSSMRFDDSVRRLFAALSDKHHLVARWLREFVCYPVEIPDHLMSEIKLAIATTLDQNQNLAVLDVRFRSNAAKLDKWARHFNAYNGEMVSRAYAPLNIRQHLACLSAIHPHDVNQAKRSRRRCRAIEMLDANVLSLIFRMAAQCMRRRVYVGREFVELE